MADKIVVLQDGKIEQIGTPHELYHRPQSKFVAGFIGSPRMNFLDATCTSISNGVEVYFGGSNSAFIPVSPNGLHNGQKVSLGIRPDDFTSPIPGLDQLRVEIEVEYVENLGSATYIYGKAGHESLVARAPASGNFSINSGTVSLSVPTRDCYLFDANGQACPRSEVPKPWDKVK
jgi:multiple sugar transport system ATP-binding protein/lactose/L-arabinose transport system ATP-binding protein